jgi:hypothetical protein
MALVRNTIESERKVAIFETRRSSITLQQLYIIKDELDDWASCRQEGWNKTDIRFDSRAILTTEDFEEFMKDTQEALKLAKEWDKDISK